MYTDELREASLSVDSIFLDPNNPRFWTTERSRLVPDHRTPDLRVQSKAEDRLESHKIVELRNSILRNGFLPLDRIVVRPLKDVPDKYVVVEGNRRLAALRKLRGQITEQTVVEDNISEEYLQNLLQQTNRIPVLVYEGSENIDDISWILQGIRHIGGIKDWDAAQRGKLVVAQVDDQNEPRTFSEAGETFGLNAKAVGRLYRGYKALKQMQDDDEYGSEAKNEYFTLFEEAHRNRTVREWLNWHEAGADSGFRNTENRKTFYAWISPDTDTPKKPGVPERRIHNPGHVKVFGELVSEKNRDQFNRVNAFEVGIDEANAELKAVDKTEDWSKKMNRALSLVKSVPISALREDPQKIGAILDEMLEELRSLRKLVRMAAGSSDDSK